MQEAHRQACEKHFEARGVGRVCPACQQNGMALFDYPFLLTMEDTKLVAAFCALMCPSCNHTMLFSIRSSGLLKKRADDPENRPEEVTDQE
ncbi:hypothetical protein [Fimbriiglobus ruber]|uniref:hypothetical protein n=1 Tax=Fimbriiglobus ruber TaxID=1908690 RepID=UPI0011799681|nr:hypothetical protein [Fimbriiglobus ruber]